MASSSAVAPPGTRLGPRQNLETPERVISALGGTVLGLVAAKRGGVSGALLGALGAALVARGATGAAPVKRLIGPGPDDKAAAKRQGWSSAAVFSRAVAINKPASEVYAFFRKFSNLPTFMENIAEIVETGDKHSRWTVTGPGGVKVSWDAVLTADEPGRLIAWKTLPGSTIENTGRVEFRDAPGGRGSEVHATIAYKPPGGTAGKLVAKLTQREPGIQIRRDLKRLKMLLETGEIATNAPQGTTPKS
ncbi:MAG: SRPBCC family protein [Sphingomonadaceae bacterium]|nr:SRPBCC family protein [Sphingomonadaceae bacterium]